MDARNEIASLLASLADPSRLRVLGVLADGDYCVTEVAARVGLSQSCTTRHLQTLQRAGVLDRARDGKKVRFRIRRDDPAIERLVEFVLLRQARVLPAHPRLGGALLHVSGANDAVRPAPVETPEPAVALGTAVPDAVSIPARRTPGATAVASAPPHADAGSSSTDIPAEAVPELEDYLL